MTKTTKIALELEQSWVFIPLDERARGQWQTASPPTMTIPRELYEEYLQVSSKFYELNAKFEQLYRIQEGKEPFENTAIPKHRMIK